MSLDGISVIVTEDQMRIIRGLIADKVEYLAGWESFYSFVDSLHGILALLNQAEASAASSAECSKCHHPQCGRYGYCPMDM